MKHLFHFFAGVSILAASQTGVQAQTVTVAKTGTPSFPTIQAALDSFVPDPNPSSPNVIQITDDAVYDEVLTIKSDVVLEGTAPVRPTLAVQANAAGRNGSGGVVINVPDTFTSAAVVLRNLIVLPSTLGSPQSTAIENIANNVYVELDGILLTGNEGDNTPVSETGLMYTPDNPAFYHFGDDGIVLGISSGGQFEGAGVELVMKDCVITHLRGASTSADGLTLTGTTGQTRKLRIEDGCIFSFMRRNGMNIGGADIQIDGSAEPVRSMFNGEYGAVLNGGAPTQSFVDGFMAYNNGRAGIYESAAEGVRIDVSNSIIAHNARQNIWLLGAATDEVKLTNVTLVNAMGTSYNTLRLDASLAANVTIKDSIIAGNGSTNIANVVYNYGTGTLTLENTALVTEGRYALATPPIDGTATVVGTPVTTADPWFDAIGYALSDFFFDVRNPAYATLSSTNGGLAGGATYNGTTPITPSVSVTVAKTGSPDFSTIQDAIDSFTSLHPETTKTIQITDSAVYDEVVTVHLPVNIQGNANARPTIAVRGNKLGYETPGAGATLTNGYGGLLLGLPTPATSGTVGLKNLILIPSSTDTTQPLFAVNNYHNNVHLQADNLLITGNNGADLPISVNGMSLVPADPAHKHFKLSGIHLGSINAGRLNLNGVELEVANTIITNLRGTTGTPGTGLTGYANGIWVGRPGYSMTRIYDGCVISYGGGSGLVINGEADIYAPNQRLLLLNHGFNGMSFDNFASVVRRIDGINVMENNTGIFDNSSTGLKHSLHNAIVYNNRVYNIWYRRGAAPALMENVTTAKQGLTVSPVFSQTGSNPYTGTLTFRDCIVGGNGQTTATTNIVNTAKVTLEGTAIVQAGPFALNETGAFPAGATITGAPTTTADPLFVETEDYHSAGFLDVASTAYATANVAGGPLGGGADYVGMSNVMNWTLY